MCKFKNTLNTLTPSNMHLPCSTFPYNASGNANMWWPDLVWERISCRVKVKCANTQNPIVGTLTSRGITEPLEILLEVESALLARNL